VVQSTFVRIADIHAGPLSDCFQALQFIDLGGVIFLRLTDSGSVGLTFPIVRIFVFHNA
jgi:hypothetical protein